MKKNGFTLPEVLGVITVLALLALLIAPIITKVIKDNKQRLYNIQIKEIEKAAKDYALKNTDVLPEDGSSTIITLEEIKKGGYIQKDVRNPITKELFSDELKIEITNHYNQYTYTVLQETRGVSS